MAWEFDGGFYPPYGAGRVKTQVLINGVDVSSYLISYEYERTYGDLLPEIIIKLNRKTATVLNPAVGQTVLVYRGSILPTDELIFNGYVEKQEVDGGLYTITGIDKLWDLVRKEMTHTYDSSIDVSAGVISEIFKDIVTTYAGLNADSTTIQNSGSVALLSKFVCSHVDPMDRCRALAEALDWQFYYRADTDKVYFEPVGYNSNSSVLSVGSNVYNVPRWNSDITQMVNDLTIIGAYQLIETTESGTIGTTSGYTTASITLAYQPVSIKVYNNTVSTTVPLVGGVVDSTSSYVYYVDKTQKKIYPKGGTTFTNAQVYEVRYSLQAPIPIHMYNQHSIDDYGRFQKTITYNDIASVADAEQRGTNHLNKFSTPFKYATLRLKNAIEDGIRVGQRIRVVDTINVPSVDEFLVINKHRIRYPGDYDEVDVGDAYWRLSDWQGKMTEKIKRLHEQEIQNADISNELISVDNENYSPVTIANRYVSISTQTVTGTNCFIVGHPDYSIVGTARVGSTDLTSESSFAIQQYNNVYNEDFFDDDFKNASTTATWNTGTGELTFTSGQVGVSNNVDYNNGTITTATILVTSASGSFTIELSADDGAHYESVINGVAHSFTNTGSGLRWRITENAASTGVITNIYINNYH